MCDILFVVPAEKPTFREESSGTLLLATILKNNNIAVDIYRYYEADISKPFNSFIEETVDNILSRKPSVVSFYCRCDCILANIRIAEKIKDRCPSVSIVFGGPQADASSTELISTLSFVDFCCCGEGETTILPFVSALLKKEDTSNIPGLVYRDKNNNVVKNPRPELLKNLDDLPDIDYSLVPEGTMNPENNREILIESGRGCPFRCAYCSTSIFWKRTFRLKSSKKIVDEIQYLHETYGFSHFTFPNDLFTVNKKVVLDFCNEIEKRNLHVTWSCSARIDTLDESVISAMASAGLRSVFLGIETGSERIQKLAHKNINKDDVINTVRLLNKYKVKNTSSFMFGFPEETEEDLEATLRLAYDVYTIGTKAMQFHLCAILPGTEYYETYKDQLTFACKQSNIVGTFGVDENMDFITDNLNLFPFYYEYSSPLRTKFKDLERLMLICLEIYKHMLGLDKSRFEKISLVDLYCAVNDANSHILTDKTSAHDCRNRFVEIACNYLSIIYNEEEMKVLREVFTFHQDLFLMQKDKQFVTDIKTYNINVSTMSNCSLKEIKQTPVMVVFRKSNGELTYVANPLM